MTVYNNAQEDVKEELRIATSRVKRRGIKKLIHNVNIEKRIMSLKNCSSNDSPSAKK